MVKSRYVFFKAMLYRGLILGAKRIQTKINLEVRGYFIPLAS